ncbi:Delta(14)-sterol reductase [Venturia inaequalis]|uniref:Delta(14)-sterol reductase n=1 Tax=Venturia inaequalis TaxID=5025 RepID=A0A8H3V876_VENIN|nr:Delta(14)-sterol reductase [Venturia inaequalis]
MATKDKSVAKAPEKHGYEFFGPPGAFFITTTLPLTCYAFSFFCNDITGCPAPSLLSPSTLTLESLKKDVGWHGWSTIFTWEAMAANFAYYFLSLVLYRFLPGTEATGGVTNAGHRLSYRLNAFNSALFISSVLAAGTLLQGAEFPVWTFIYDNQLPLLTANILLSYFLATYVYLCSFGVKSGNKESRELAAGGHSGNMLYDWFIGRELNPRIDLPVFGTVDIKVWMEMRPGLLGWIILDCAFIAAQYRHFGYVTDSIIITTVAQAVYVFDALYMEPAILTTIDIISDGFGFMLAFGDIVWVPFIYSLQARYLSIHPVDLGVYSAIPIGVLLAGYAIFRGANNEKNRFRNDPNDPKVAHLKYMETAAGSKLLVSGWWGTARHINYLGDWFLSWSYCLPTGIAGYEILRGISAASTAVGTGESYTMLSGKGLDGGHAALGRTVVTPGQAKGWGMIVTYFFMLYFAILLIHRERRDEEKCRKKYGKDWDEYCKRVPSRIIPGIY